MMEFHPLSGLFPLMDDVALAALTNDIRANGQIEPIAVLEGKILDGRNRWRACQTLKIEPFLKYLNGADPLTYVLSENLHRRHLSTSQRAYIAAELETLKRGRPGKDANLHVSRDDAAKMLNVSPRSVATAAFVRDHGTPEERDAVRGGAKTARRVAENIRDRQNRQGRANKPKPQSSAGRPAYKAFAHSIAIVVQACESCLHIDVPRRLTAETASETLMHLRRARSDLSHLIKTLEGEAKCQS